MVAVSTVEVRDTLFLLVFKQFLGKEDSLRKVLDFLLLRLWR